MKEEEKAPPVVEGGQRDRMKMRRFDEIYAELPSDVTAYMTDVSAFR